MTEEKLCQLIRELDEKTHAGKLSWEETVREGRFQASLGRAVVEVFSDDDGDFRLRILNGLGTLVEEVWGSELRNRIKDKKLEEAMPRLLREARRSAMHADEEVDQILANLKGRG